MGVALLRFAGVLAPLLALARLGQASFICDTLGVAGDFIAVAERAIVTKVTRNTSGEPIGSRFDGAVCARRLVLQGAEVGGSVAPELGSSPPAIALASSGTAIAIRSFPDEGTTAGTDLDGDLVTGGGRITGRPTEHFGAIDTSGTDPRVGRCADAVAAAHAASAAFAALPSTLELGRVRIRRDDVLTIDGRGGVVVHLDALKTDATGGRFAGENRLCERAFEGGHEPARLEIRGNLGDEIVVNVDRLGLGSCTIVDVDEVNVIVNVPGRGAAVRIGYGVGGEVLGWQLPILAPARHLVLGGSADDDYETRLAGFWARNARMNGNTQALDTILGCQFQ